MPIHPPAGFLEDPSWADARLRSVYVDLQLRADPDGSVRGFSLRRACEWWGESRRKASDFLHTLDDRGLVRFPEGQPNRPYRVELTDPWTLPVTTNVTTESGDIPRGAADIHAEAGQQTGQRTEPADAETEAVTAESPESVTAPNSSNDPDPGRPGSGVRDSKNNPERDNDELPFEDPSSPPTPPSTTTSLSSAKAPDKDGVRGVFGDDDQGELIDPEEIEVEVTKEHTHRMMQLLVELGFKGQQVTGNLYGKQAKVIRELMDDQGVAAVERAMRGMVRIFPHDSEGGNKPWDAFKLRKRFAEALAEGPARTERQRRQEQQQRAQAAERVKARKEREYQEAHDEWLARVRRKVRNLPDEERRALVEKTNRAEKELPLRPPTGQRRTQFRIRLACTIWGRENDDPPPRR